MYLNAHKLVFLVEGTTHVSKTVCDSLKRELMLTLDQVDTSCFYPLQSKCWITNLRCSWLSYKLLNWKCQFFQVEHKCCVFKYVFMCLKVNTRSSLLPEKWLKRNGLQGLGFTCWSICIKSPFLILPYTKNWPSDPALERGILTQFPPLSLYKFGQCRGLPGEEVALARST